MTDEANFKLKQEITTIIQTKLHNSYIIQENKTVKIRNVCESGFLTVLRNQKRKQSKY